MAFSERESWVQDAIRNGLIPPTNSSETPKCSPTIKQHLTVAKPRKAKAVKTQAAHWSVTLTVPCLTVSEMNRREHWTARHKRFSAHKAAVFDVWFAFDRSNWRPTFPLKVTLTRMGRKLDDDNLNGALKAVRDAVAHLLSIDDGDPRIEWRYEQRAGTPGVEVRIEPRGHDGR